MALSLARQRQEQADARKNAEAIAIARFEAAAEAADEEARAADQRAADLRGDADRITPEPARRASVRAVLAAAEDRYVALKRERGDGIVAGELEAVLQRISVQVGDAAQECDEAEAELRVLADLDAEAGRVRSEAAAYADSAQTAREKAALLRAQAGAVPEVARKQAVMEWENEQRRAQLRPGRKPERAMPPALVFDGRLYHDVNTGQMYDLNGRPVVPARVA